MLYAKTKRIENRELLDAVKLQPCAALMSGRCGGPVDPHHVTTRGAGGDDVPENIMPLCRFHHTEWDKIGPARMIERHPGVEDWLISFDRVDVLEKWRSK